MHVELARECSGVVVGWGRPAKAARNHYFVDGTSLCGHWQFHGGMLDPGYPRSHDCAECRRHWRREHARQRQTRRIH